MAAQDKYQKDFKYPLLKGERIKSISVHSLRPGAKRLSSLQQMLRLTGAKRSSQIGRRPSIAATALEHSGLTTPEHLRLFETIFGRDSLRVAIDLISTYPKLARTTVLALAELQGVAFYKEREEEPGRIVHEARDPDDLLARHISEHRGWHWPYYGSVDATPEFVRTLVAYVQTGKYDFLKKSYQARDGRRKTIADALDAAIAWILYRLDENAEGILEYKSILPHGIENQVWKDSWDAYHHADGTIANHDQGIASIEVQVTAYDALLEAADLYEDVLGNSAKALMLRGRAKRLKKAILTYFWTRQKGGYFVLGTDRDLAGNLRQMKIRTSNMGHALNSRLLEDDTKDSQEKVHALVSQLWSPQMLNVSGIRTLASDEIRFRPGAYHNGSVWLWDTHHIAKGLRRHGFVHKADELDKRILNAVNTLRCFPEYVRGDDGRKPSINTMTVIIEDTKYHKENQVEQPPQEVQAWTVAAILATQKRLQRRKIQEIPKD